MSWCVGDEKTTVEETDDKRVTHHAEGLYTSPASSVTSRCNYVSSEWVVYKPRAELNANKKKASF